MIFDQTYQLKQGVEVDYEAPNGFTHTNRLHHCETCKDVTLQAVYRNTTAFTNTANTIRVTSEAEYRDCLICTNTTYKSISKKREYLGGAS